MNLGQENGLWVCLYTSIVWSISCAAMVDATATATADDTANCPAPPRGSALRSSGSDKKSGGAIGCTHSAGNAPDRPNTAPNFHPDKQWTEDNHQPNHTKAYTCGVFVPLNHPQSWSLSALETQVNTSFKARSLSTCFCLFFLFYLQDLILPCNYTDNLVQNIAFGLITGIDDWLPTSKFTRTVATTMTCLTWSLVLIFR